MQNQNLNLNIDLSTTQEVTHKNGNVWQQGFIIRKVSKFIAGTDEDALIPIPVFFDPGSGEILEATLPPELRSSNKPKGNLDIVSED